MVPAVGIEPTRPQGTRDFESHSSADDTISKNNTAPSTPRAGALRAALVISDTASRIRLMAGYERPPKELRRKWLRKTHLCSDRIVTIVYSVRAATFLG